ncbi:hypothetical protein [Bacillus subtilis]|nr:hypothetical protein [Bacillus subtilis]
MRIIITNYFKMRRESSAYRKILFRDTAVQQLIILSTKKLAEK